MTQINLQHKTSPKAGHCELYWFENEKTNLPKTLFHRFYIPLAPFDSGLTYEDDPVNTEIVFDWLTLNLSDPTNLDGVTLPSSSENNVEISMYLGNAHNPCDIKTLTLKRIENNTFELNCELVINFEHEMVAKNELFKFATKLSVNPNIKP